MSRPWRCNSAAFASTAKAFSSPMREKAGLMAITGDLPSDDAYLAGTGGRSKGLRAKLAPEHNVRDRDGRARKEALSNGL